MPYYSPMRSILTAALLVCLAAGASAEELRTDGAVAGGSFGMGGADYYGDVRSRMPFTRQAPPRQIGLADIVRVRAARTRPDAAARRPAPNRQWHRG